DFTFRNARLTVTEELKRAEDEKRLTRVSRFLSERVCPACHGTRLSPAAAAPRIGGIGLAEATAKTLEEHVERAAEMPAALPQQMRTLAAGLVDTLVRMARRRLDLGLGYLALDRAGSPPSTGEAQARQRG